MSQPNSFLIPRYSDAYDIASSTIRTGNLLKSLAIGLFVLGILVLVIGIKKSSETLLTAGVVIAVGSISPFILGMLLSAQGVIIRAVLDTAIHTSPLLSTEEKSRLVNWSDSNT
jgi:vacuolar-type H+-ATPase subunit I/STV1